MRRLNARGIAYYMAQKGAYDRGTVLLKIALLDGTCRLLTQQRDLDGTLQWIDVVNEGRPAEKKADEYIARAKARDPDVWIIEIESREGINFFAEEL